MDALGAARKLAHRIHKLTYKGKGGCECGSGRRKRRGRGMEYGDGGYMKKSMTPYNRFVKTHMHKMKNSGMSATERMREIGHMWRSGHK